MIKEDGIIIDYIKKESLNSKSELSCKLRFNSQTLNYPLIVYYS
jgi:hypothetical protein